MDERLDSVELPARLRGKVNNRICPWGMMLAANLIAVLNLPIVYAARPFLPTSFAQGQEIPGWDRQSGQSPAGRSQAEALAPALETVAGMAAGYAHALAFTREGRVYAWGENSAGQLGVGNTRASHEPVPVIGLPTHDPVVAVAAGYLHSVALTASGHVYAWGDNHDGQLGIAGVSSSAMPLAVPLPPHITSIAAGALFNLALTADGRVYGWGDDRAGEVGGAAIGRVLVPPAVQADLPKGAIVQICAGAVYALALSRTGRLFAWGDNSYFQLGSLGNGDPSIPEPIAHLPVGDYPVAIACGAFFGLMLTRQGRVYAWGDGNHGQLGDSSSGFITSVPEQVEGLPVIDTIDKVAAGESQCLALSRAGRRLCLGR